MITNVKEYWLGQIGIFGLFLFPLANFLRVTYLARSKNHNQWPSLNRSFNLSPDVKRLWISTALLPILSFGAVALFQKVEANWPAMYLVTMSLLLGVYIEFNGPILKRLIVAHTILILAFIGYSLTASHFSTLTNNRLLREFHGFAQLADYLKNDNNPIFADSYQLATTLSYHSHHHGIKNIAQWPGLTRNSELTRRREMANEIGVGLKLTLVTTLIIPPYLVGFRVDRLVEFRSCLSKPMIYEANLFWKYVPECKAPVHRWFVVDYVRV